MSTKESVEKTNQVLKLVMKSGQAALGLKSTLKTLRNGKSKLVLIASNCPIVRKSQLEYYAMLSKVQIIHYTGTNNELGNFSLSSAKNECGFALKN
jgi:large subunit ribosomal protein L30e